MLGLFDTKGEKIYKGYAGRAASSFHQSLMDNRSRVSVLSGCDKWGAGMSPSNHRNHFIPDTYTLETHGHVHSCYRITTTNFFPMITDHWTFNQKTLELCDWCNKHFTYDCYHDLSIPEAMWEDYKYLGMDKCCMGCLGVKEKNFLAGSFPVNLPLLINHQWFTDEGKNRYKKHIQKAVV